MTTCGYIYIYIYIYIYSRAHSRTSLGAINTLNLGPSVLKKKSLKMGENDFSLGVASKMPLF